MTVAEDTRRLRLDLHDGLSSAGGFVLAWLVTNAVVWAWELVGGDAGPSLVPDLIWGHYLGGVVSALLVAGLLGSVQWRGLGTPGRGLIVMSGAVAALVVTTSVANSGATPVLVGVLVFSGAPLWIFLAALIGLAHGGSTSQGRERRP